MARRGQTGDDKSRKRPSQTLDLKASEVRQDEKGAVDSLAAEDQNKADDGEKLDASRSEKTEKKDSASYKKPSEASLKTEKVEVRQSFGGGFFKMLLAAVFGGGLALGGQYGLTHYGLIEGDLIRGDESGSVGVQIEALEQKINGFDRVGIEAKLAQLAQKLEAGPANSDLITRLQQVEATLKDVSNVAASSDQGIEGLTALAVKLNKLEASVEERINAARLGLSEKMQQEVTKLSQVVAKQETLTQVEGVKLTADQLGRQLAKIEARSNQLAEKVAGVNTALGEVRSNGVSKVMLNEELLKVKTELATLQGVTAELKDRERAAHETARRSALTLAFSNLKRAMGRGDGFLTELEAVERLAPNNDLQGEGFAVLKRLASQGVANEQQLLKAFPDLASTAIASNLKDPEASTWDQMVGKARKAFRYRRTGDVQGEGTEAVLARMEYKFKAGQLEAVVEEAEALQVEARSVVAPWLEKLKARLVVEQAMFKLEDQLMAGLQARVPERR